MTEETSKELIEKLTNDIDEAKWELIKDHHARGAAFLVDDSLDLVAVGVAMAKDQVEYIRGWLGEGKILQPTEELIEAWNEADVFFRYLIIQPYVLIQIKREEME
ncbi:DUF2288 domain-containing protein [Bacteriovorax sp. Seq25_V]|uniref:DUF2288 domain-containing protein n=1 Tax=Bacteriovorax sp. Seq25_V TaxID=1201288 RepID=UPI00038A1BE6|nr:DUF2288 domain-containing protein [Bacteriovorax sp. Seq25_V]EQC45476.1 PF10052 family protein [Bacteriovorax sp. Seq25_V]